MLDVFILTQLVVEVDLFLSIDSPQQVQYYVCKVLTVETEFPCSLKLTNVPDPLRLTQHQHDGPLQVLFLL